MVRLIGTALVSATLLSASAATAAESKVLAHDVYFALNDASADAKAKLVAACKKYLTGYEGTVSFAVGARAGEMDRPVNDRDYDVSLHVYFRDKSAHDKYQDAPRHNQFIQEMQGNWKKVRVFDSWVEISK
jgi:Stress responsive A/B Barrel Domain